MAADLSTLRVERAVRGAAVKVTQHVPGYFDGVDPCRDDVATLEELLALPWVKQWEQPFRGLPFVGWRQATGSLLALYGEDESSWWVVAHAPKEALASLPEWRISPAGQAKVDKWNRGDVS